MTDLKTKLEDELDRLIIVKREALENEGIEYYEQFEEGENKADYDTARAQGLIVNRMLNELKSLENSFEYYQNGMRV